MVDGRLVYLIGPSGSGKDTLIALARKILNKNNDLYFSRRYVTRAHAEGTDVACTAEEFAGYVKRGIFALNWEAHGLRYGIKTVIDSQLRAGKCVVVNGSRAYLAAALARYPRLIPVLISVPPEVARERLLARKREDAASMAERLSRSPGIAVPPSRLVTVDNNGPPEEAARALVEILVGDGHQGFGGTHSRVSAL